jgi:hypothetical protein
MWMVFICVCVGVSFFGEHDLNESEIKLVSEERRRCHHEKSDMSMLLSAPPYSGGAASSAIVVTARSELRPRGDARLPRV